MGQVIDIDYEESPVFSISPSVPIDVSRRSEPMGDVYDVYNMVSNVHSNISEMNKDYVLAQYTSDVINNKFPKFVREQRKILRIIKSYLIIPDSILQERFNNNDVINEVKIKLMSSFIEIEKLLLGEVEEMVIMSRAGKGEVTRAMLLHGRTKEEREEFDEGEFKSTMNKLMEKKKK